MTFIKPVLLVIMVLVTIFESSSEAIVFDYFDKKGNIIVRRYPKSEWPRQPDTSCLFLHENNVLNLPAPEAIKAISRMRLDRKIDLYLCSSNADVREVSVTLMHTLTRDLPKNIDHFNRRLLAAHDDMDKMSLLMIYMLYGFDEIFKKTKGSGAFPDSDLPFVPELARLLVQKASELKDPEKRDFFLDRLIPMLPHDEAMAREAQREPAEWVRVK